MNTATFDVYDKNLYKNFCAPAQIERDLQTLSGLITGISCDRDINQLEREGLCNWMDKIKEYGRAEPYRSLLRALNEALYDNVITKEEADDIVWLCNQYVDRIGYYDMITSTIQKLTGIVEGIIVDKEINEQELSFLLEWMDENDNLKNCWPYDELYTFIMHVLKDKVITEEERVQVMKFCSAIVGSNAGTTNDDLVEIINEGYCQMDPDIKITESSFCITGNSKKFRRREIAEKIELFGGFVTDKVSKNINYLVVCDEKNNCWAYTCYGRKIEQTVMLRKSGHPIAIVHEFDLYDALAGME